MGRAGLVVVAIVAVAAVAVLAWGGGPDGDGAARPRVASPWPFTGPTRAAEVWAVGDGAIGNERSEALAAMIRARDPDAFLYLGDVYPDGTAEDYLERYAPSWGLMADVTVPTPGNHEWPQRQEGYFPYWREVHGRVPMYSTFPIAGWTVLNLNSELDGDAMRRQVRWARAQVAGGGNCRIAMWHAPRYSAGNHGDDEDVTGLWNAVEGRARLVLNGHDHGSQRLRPIGGTIELIAGAGGARLYELHDDPRLAWGDNEHVAALRLRLRPRRARWAFVALGGKVLDSGSTRCRR